ncbi:MAG: glycosyltransferase family 4 protein [Phenylobacterium sp.]
MAEDLTNPEPGGGKRLRLAYVCSGDPLDVRTWSGTPFHMLEALRRRADIVEVVRKPWSGWFDLGRRALRKLSGGRYDVYWSPFWSRLGSASAVERLKRVSCDAVITVAVTPITTQLVDSQNTVFISDATFLVMSDYNINFQKLAPSHKKSAHELEGQAIRHATISAFPSHWAQSSALADYQGDPDRTLQIPWGANLVASSITPVDQRPKSPWRLLFVGVDWYGKGGDIVLQTLEALRARGCQVELDIVGCAPSEPPPHVDGVTFHGFISKNTPEGRQRLEDLFRRAHLFLLPTRFDAFPTVIAESASFGVPAVSYRTGGLPSNVLHGETGILIDEGAPAAAFADAIAELMAAPARYSKMANAALRFSHEALNWDSWAQRLLAALTAQVEARRAKGGANS